MPKKIAYIGEFRFPKGDASSVRVLGVGQILASCGFDVSFHGITLEKESSDFQGVFHGFQYSNLKIPKGNILQRVINRFMGGFRVVKMLRTIRPDYIIMAGGYSRYLLPLLSFAKKNNVKVIADVVEWYDYANLPGGKYGLYALDVELALTRFMKKCDGIIAISSFLESYFVNAGTNAVRIPIVIDKTDRRWETGSTESFDPSALNLVYAGIPGKKDLISVVIRGTEELVRRGHKVKLHLIGPSRDSIKTLLGENDDLHNRFDDFIIFHGKVNQDSVPALISRADFSVLVRPNERYANAGFPTKFVESLAVGLPVISNLTSDLGLYLKDGENGFVMHDHSVSSFIQCAERALLMTQEDRKKMRNAAKSEAQQSFDYREYISATKSFFDKIVSSEHPSR